MKKLNEKVEGIIILITITLMIVAGGFAEGCDFVSAAACMGLSGIGFIVLSRFGRFWGADL